MLAVDPNVVTIQLPDELVNYLESLDYEAAGLQVLHTHALNAGVPAEKTAEIQKRFQEAFAEYQMAKREMWARFGRDYPGKRWQVDFQEGVLRVEQG